MFSGSITAQTCSINGKSYACINDLNSFSYSSSAMVSSVAWNFGDGNSSTVTSPNYNYTSAGTYTVQLILALTGGGSCTATHTIDIYENPKAVSSLSAVSFCFPNTRLCLTDSSKPSDLSRPITKRLILWGDGAGDSTTNAANIKTHCYNYLTPGVYNVLMEVTDNKGCRSQNVKVVTVHDATVNLGFGQKVLYLCDTNQYCVKNASFYDSSQKIAFTWFLNNSFKTVDSNGFCFQVQGTGMATVKLAYTNKYGCTDTFQKNYNYFTRSFTPVLSSIPDTSCYGAYTNFTYTAADTPGRKHYWQFHNESFSIDDIAQSYGKDFSVRFTHPGKWKLTYTASENDCYKSIVDSIEIIGPKARYRIFNADQCNINDSVIFHDNSVYYKNGGVFRLWDFADKKALQCTTITVLGKNIGKNCNFSRDSMTKHYYDSAICYIPKYYIYDSLSGCSDSAFSFVKRSLKITASTLTNDRMTNPVYCLNEEAEINYKAASICDASPLKMLIDSANPSEIWQNFKVNVKYDKLPKADSGWVTFGIVLQFGSPSRTFHLSADSTVYDTKGICYDTVWFPRFLRVIAPPVVRPVLVSLEKCLPFKAVFKLKDSINIPVYRYVVNWGDDTETIDTLDGKSMPDSFVHFYKKGLRANVRIYVATKQGFEAVGFEYLSNGFLPDFYFKKEVCLGDTARFIDSVFYIGSSTSAWRNANAKETLNWNFGDGSAWVQAVKPKYVYTTPGKYTVTMVAIDSSGCTDTVRKEIIIPDIKAGLKNLTQKLVCGDITRFFDSSMVIGGYPQDSISKWFWSFGDGTAKSLLKNPFHNYPKPGTYPLKHIAENTYGCKDSIIVAIKIEGPIPYFEILNDTVACPNHLAFFDNMSTNATQYLWNFGKVFNNILNTDRDTNVNYLYSNPGTYDIFLTATDSIYNPITMDYSFCSAIFPDTTEPNAPIRRIRILPIPPVDFEMPDTVCVGRSFVLQDKSASIYSNYRWYFESDDSLISAQKTNTYTFNKTGNYLVKYKPLYVPSFPYLPICVDSTSHTIEVVKFDVDFIIKNSEDSGYYLFFEKADETAIPYLWNFGHPASGKKNSATIPNPEHDYGGDTGTFMVCLIAESKFGCRDTVCKPLTNKFFPYIVLYNFFSPNGDGYNDAYDIKIEEEILYQIIIYNRWGTEVFQGSNDGTANDGINWSGRIKNVGPICAEGTYYYNFNYQFKGRKTENKTVYGVITLMR